MRWYTRLADIPSVDYPRSPAINRVRLAGHNLTPDIRSYEFDGRRCELAMWKHQDGESSASPARHWQTQAEGDRLTPEAILQRLFEALELPGEPSDYHFAIQGCFERLWSFRRDHPWVLAEVERLCWLDIRLLEAEPGISRFERADGEATYARSFAFERLIRLYERNGYLRAALDVARRATQFHAEDAILMPLRERLANLEAEHDD